MHSCIPYALLSGNGPNGKAKLEEENSDQLLSGPPVFLVQKAVTDASEGSGLTAIYQ